MKRVRGRMKSETETDNKMPETAPHNVLDVFIKLGEGGGGLVARIRARGHVFIPW